MRADVIAYIHADPDLKQYLREQPMWYRTLTRNPSDLEKFEVESLNYFRKTFVHKVEKLSNGMQMASMMMSMFQSINQQ